MDVESDTTERSSSGMRVFDDPASLRSTRLSTLQFCGNGQCEMVLMFASKRMSVDFLASEDASNESYVVIPGKPDRVDTFRSAPPAVPDDWLLATTHGDHA